MKTWKIMKESTSFRRCFNRKKMRLEQLIGKVWLFPFKISNKNSNQSQCREANQGRSELPIKLQTLLTRTKTVAKLAEHSLYSSEYSMWPGTELRKKFCLKEEGNYFMRELKKNTNFTLYEPYERIQQEGKMDLREGGKKSLKWLESQSERAERDPIKRSLQTDIFFFDLYLPQWRYLVWRYHTLSFWILNKSLTVVQSTCFIINRTGRGLNNDKIKIRQAIVPRIANEAQAPEPKQTEASGW